MSDLTPLEVLVWADMACFTRPENKVERVSYPVMTPSAARGVLEAIFWKPEFAWQVREIVVLKPVRFFGMLRNEVELKASAGRPNGFYASDARQQRQTLALADVAYVIRADIAPRPHVADEDPAKWRDQFRRRVERGQCFHRPYLGCREFAAHFAKPDGSETPVTQTSDLGLMLFDIAFRPDSNARRLTFARHGGRSDDGTTRERQNVGGVASPIFFEARLDGGVLRVRPELYAMTEGAAS